MERNEMKVGADRARSHDEPAHEEEGRGSTTSGDEKYELERINSDTSIGDSGFGGCFDTGSLINVIDSYIRTGYSYVVPEPQLSSTESKDSDQNEIRAEHSIGIHKKSISNASTCSSTSTNDILSSIMVADTDASVRKEVLRNYFDTTSSEQTTSVAMSNHQMTSRNSTERPERSNVEALGAAPFPFADSSKQLRTASKENGSLPSGVSLLDEHQWEQLLMAVPTRYRLLATGKYSSKWRVLYNSEKHGTSLSLMLRRCRSIHPTIIMVEDCDGVVFGSYNSDRWNGTNNGRRFFGNGECFVFTDKSECHQLRENDMENFHSEYGHKVKRTSPKHTHSKLKIHKWSGANNNAVNTGTETLCDDAEASESGDDENLPSLTGSNTNFQHVMPGSIAIGMDPSPALRLIDGLPMRGTSGRCETFNSHDSLSGREDFICNVIQVVGFINQK